MILIITFIVFLFFFLLQKYFIYPLEKTIFPSYLIDQASLLYIPHAVRIISYYVVGYLVLLPIFVSQCFTYILLNNEPIIHSLTLSLISTFSIFLGFELFNLFNKKISFTLDDIIDWKKIILIGSFVSIFNSSLSSFYLINSKNITFDLVLNVRFLIGDIFGLVFGMIIFILIIKSYVTWRKNVRN